MVFSLKRLTSLFALLGCIYSCAPEQPRLIFQSTEVGDGGRLVRDMYRSFWLPPGSDDDIVRIGLIPSREVIRFRALHRMTIRAMGEHASWEVASPEGAVWRVEPAGILRPSLMGHLAVVRSSTLPRGTLPSTRDLGEWKARGFPSARWVGPPAMDVPLAAGSLYRWALSVTPPTSESAATQVCKAARKAGGTCQVVPRIELPLIARGRLVTENGSFAKEFEGALELLSPRGPVEILDFVSDDVSGVTSSEKYSPRLFVIPTSERTLALIKSTSFGKYLEGVVPSEIFASAPTEALKAQAILARTYASRYSLLGRADRPYLLCASTDCQVYRGLGYEKPSTSAAVQETPNLVLRDAAGNLAEIYYHSTCGGHTESKEAIWGPPAKSYLIGTNDGASETKYVPLTSDVAVEKYLNEPPTSFCGISKFMRPDRWRWTVHLSETDLDALAAYAKLSAPLTNVTVLKRGISGRALELRVSSHSKSSVIRGELNIRKALGGLHSSLFLLAPLIENGVLTGLDIRGAVSGHGVGMCQMGAIGRSEAGQTFSEILKAYFPGTQLATLAGVGVE